MSAAVRFIAVVSLAAMAGLVPSRALHAQEAAASLYGRVTGADGRALAGVTVVAQSASLMLPRSATTSRAGEFALVALPPGRYVVTVSHPGLVPVKLDMRLSPAERAWTHVRLNEQNGVERAITVVDEHGAVVFPPAWATSFGSLGAFLQRQPVTGTVRSALAQVTELPGVQADSSLFVLDGMPLRHGWTFVPQGSFVGPGPEALNEVAVTTGRLPADYGRLDVTAVSAATASGGNRITGALRTTFGSADLNSDLLAHARGTDGIAGTAEYSIGAPIRENRAWLFLAGRHLAHSVTDVASVTEAPFVTRVRERFGLGKVTAAWNASHRFEGEWVGAEHRLEGAAPAGALRVADPSGLGDRTMSDRAFSGAWFGRLRGWIDVNVRYTREDGTVRSDGLATPDDPILRTPLIDRASGAIWWTSGACSSCDPRSSAHNTLRATAAGSIESRFGTHHVMAGYDVATDRLTPAGHPPGGSFEVRVPGAADVGGSAYPIVAPGSAWIVWFPDRDSGLRFRSDAFFVSDRWAPLPALSIDAGLRFDRHRGTVDASGVRFLSERTLSPRVAVMWSPGALAPWTVTGRFNRYVPGVTDRALDASLAAAPPTRVFAYDGPAINVGTPSTAPGEALGAIFDWFHAAGGTARTPVFAIEPGVSLRADASTRPPHVDEWSAGASRMLGERGDMRADIVVRTWGSLPGRTIDPMSAPDASGVDVGVSAPAQLLERKYVGLTLSAKYRFGHYASVESQYTLSRLRGTADAPALTGYLGGAALAYPEYFDAAWHVPAGALSDDATHRLRWFAYSELLASEKLGLVVLAVMHSRESGRPYGAVGPVDPRPFVSNPGYLHPPAAVAYYFTARDAFRTDGLSRTDLGISYHRRLPGSVHGELFAAFHVLNLTDSVRALHPQRLVVTRTALSDPSLQPFNPFIDTPVRGVHWTLDDAAVTSDSDVVPFVTTLPRAFRLTLGIRF